MVYGFFIPADAAWWHILTHTICLISYLFLLTNNRRPGTFKRRSYATLVYISFCTSRSFLRWSHLWTKSNLFIFLIFISWKSSFNRKLSTNISFVFIHWRICSILINFDIHYFWIDLNMFSKLVFSQSVWKIVHAKIIQVPRFLKLTHRVIMTSWLPNATCASFIACSATCFGN